VRILSGLYGLLRPLDLIRPYRLEMGTRWAPGRKKTLYQLWGNKISGALAADLQSMYLAAGAGARPLEVAIGFYESWNSILYNSALWVRLGGDGPLIRHVHRKNFLPTYGLFDEERFVERGHDIRAFDTPWGRFAMLVCEDAWHSLSGTLLALDGASMIFISAAAPARGVYPREDAIQASLEDLKETTPKLDGMKPTDFFDPSLIIELENEDFFSKLEKQ